MNNQDPQTAIDYNLYPASARPSGLHVPQPADNDLAKQLEAERKRADEAVAELKFEREQHQIDNDGNQDWINSLCKELCAMEDALGFKNDCHDKEGKWVPTIGPWLERLRDLIAAEGELGDVKDELAAFHTAMQRERKAAQDMDWQQVVLNGGPPCFHLEYNRFCGRAQRWDGHPEIHAFVPLHELLSLKANFVPTDLEIKALKEQLTAHTQALKVAKEALGLSYDVDLRDRAISTINDLLK